MTSLREQAAGAWRSAERRARVDASSHRKAQTAVRDLRAVVGDRWPVKVGAIVGDRVELRADDVSFVWESGLLHVVVGGKDHPVVTLADVGAAMEGGR